MKRKDQKASNRSTLAAASILLGSLASLGITNAEASQLVSFKGLGSGGELRQNIIQNFDGGLYTSYHNPSDALSNHDKSGEGKCGEGKCGDDKKSPTPGTDKKAGEGKCGEGKCG